MRQEQQLRRAKWRIALVCCALMFCWLPVAPADEAHRVIDAAQRKVVKLYGAGGVKGITGYGAGVLVSPNGHILTAWSPMLDTDAAFAVLANGRRYPMKLIGFDLKLDIAVLKIDETDLPFFDVQATPRLGPGARVLALSNLFKVATGDEPVSVQRGVIAARTKLEARRGAFQASYRGTVFVLDSITCNPGAAGGALTTLDGRLVGLLGKELRHSQTQTWLNYAMPIDELRVAIEELMVGRSRRGVESATTTVAMADLAPFGLALVADVLAKTPPYVDRAAAGSSAEKAGLLPDDLIVFVEDELTPSVRAVRQALAKWRTSRTIKLVVRRGEQVLTLTMPNPEAPR